MLKLRWLSLLPTKPVTMQNTRALNQNSEPAARALSTHRAGQAGQGNVRCAFSPLSSLLPGRPLKASNTNDSTSANTDPAM